jgi:hypothetical protein
MSAPAAMIWSRPPRARGDPICSPGGGLPTHDEMFLGGAPVLSAVRDARSGRNFRGELSLTHQSGTAYRWTHAPPTVISSGKAS